MNRRPAGQCRAGRPDDYLPCQGLAEYLEYRAVAERDDEKVAVWPGLNVGRDPEVATEQQALALCDLMFGEVVGHPVLQPRIVHADHPAVASQIEMEQIPSL